MKRRNRPRPWLVASPLLVACAGLLLLCVGLFLGRAATSLAPACAPFFQGLSASSAYAEDEGKKDAEGKDGEKKEGEEDEGDENESPLDPCDDKQAKLLAAEVKKISKKKNATEVLPVLEKIEELQHAQFEKPLLKLLKHPSSLVALKAAEMWEWRNHKKVAKKIWAATFGDRKVNKRRFEIKALVLKSWPRAGLTLSDKELKEVEGDWRWIVGNPNPSLGPALVAIAEYVELAKDKRLCRKLAEELDEPGVNIVNDGNNPPAEWWERRHKLWRVAKPAVVSALRELTGQEFDKTDEAKKWFEENRKTFGFDW